MTKEDVRPITADRWAFELAPYMAFVPVFLVFVPMPFTETWFIRDLNLGLLFVFGVLGLNIVGVVMAAWGSDNKYPCSAACGPQRRRSPMRSRCC